MAAYKVIIQHIGIKFNIFIKKLSKKYKQQCNIILPHGGANKMNKIFVFLAAAVAAISLVSCGAQESTPTISDSASTSDYSTLDSHGSGWGFVRVKGKTARAPCCAGCHT